MNKRILLGGLLALGLVAGPSFGCGSSCSTHSRPQGKGQGVKAGEAKDKTLATGSYTAKVAAIVCDGCGPEIEKAMRGVSGVEAAQVHSNTATVRFTIAADKKVLLSALQKVLKASADKMGMGADYTLSDVQPVIKG